MSMRALAGVLVVLISSPFFGNAASPRQASTSAKIGRDANIEDEVKALRKHPGRIKEFVLSLKEVNVPMAYCNGMGDDNEWPSFTSKELNEGAVDWVMRVQVIEKLFGAKLYSEWIGSSQVEGSEEPLLESRKNALVEKNQKCRAYYFWRTQGIYFLPPVETQAEIVKKVKKLAEKKRHR